MDYLERQRMTKIKSFGYDIVHRAIGVNISCMMVEATAESKQQITYFWNEQMLIRFDNVIDNRWFVAYSFKCRKLGIRIRRFHLVLHIHRRTGIRVPCIPCCLLQWFVLISFWNLFFHGILRFSFIFFRFCWSQCLLLICPLSLRTFYLPSFTLISVIQFSLICFQFSWIEILLGIFCGFWF